MINNISFKGIVVKNKMTPQKLKQVSDFVSQNEKLINTLEKDYDTDVFISSKKNTVSLVHKTYKNELNSYGSVDKIPFDKFDDTVIEELETAIVECEKHGKGIESDFCRMDDLALIGCAGSNYAVK